MKNKTILTVVGARPQFIKSAALSRKILELNNSSVREILVHTGQHFDEKMSNVFFEELEMDSPKYNLGISGGTHGDMTGRMLSAIEKVLIKEMPDWVVIYGDTNSTLAAALAASKLHIPIAHIEAGLRSFNMRMPEEINRIVADRLSSLLLCPTITAVENLKNEGTTSGVHLVGDVMYDVSLQFADIAESHMSILSRLGVKSKSFILATCHRAENTDSKERMTGIVNGLASLAVSRPVVFPIHPRTHAKICEYELLGNFGNVILTEPLSYLDMIVLEKNSEIIITDSGGVQKEAFFYKVPCITVRTETEWVETVQSGWNILVGSDSSRITDAVEHFSLREKQNIQPYGTGDAAERILDLLLKF